jgi:hypothetical protein
VAVELEPQAKRKCSRELKRLEFQGAPGAKTSGAPKTKKPRGKTAPRAREACKPGEKQRGKAAGRAGGAPKAKAKRVKVSSEEREAQKAEAKALATERRNSAPEPGSLLVAKLEEVMFATGTAEASPELVQWKEGVPALLARLGPHPALHTVLRRVSRPLFRPITKEERAEQVRTRGCRRNAMSMGAAV